MPASKKPRLSHEMAHVLNLARQQGRDIYWVPLVDGKGSQSRTVGRGMTIETCIRHGWLSRLAERPYTISLTEAGRAIITAYNEKRGYS